MMKKIFLVLSFILILRPSVYADINKGLVAHWSFDRDYGSIVRDESSNRFNGKSVNVSYEQGPINKAVVFNSPYDRIYIPDSAVSPPKKISDLKSGSISLWFKFQNVGSNILPIFYFGENNSSKPHNSLIIEIGHNRNQSNRRLYFTIVNKRFCFDSGFNLKENTWYHFVAVVSDSGNTGYLNGNELTNRHYNLGSNSSYTNFFADVPANNLLSIGYGRYGLDKKFFTFKGEIDDIRIYDRPLNKEEVRELWELGDTNTTYTPNFEDIAYGPYERNVLDFWKATSASPTTVVVFIHGGGFKSGDKTQIRSGRNASYLKRFLQAGVSVAAINYRFRQTTRLDTIMLDCARAIQFIRTKSNEWNIDKNKIGAFGGSAGGGATIWLGYHDDLADAYNPEPVLRESSKLQVCGHNTSQATYDFLKWPEFLDIDTNWMVDMRTREDLDLYHITDRKEYYTPEIIKLRHFLDMPAFLDANDPPTYLLCLNPNTKPTNAGAVIHHPGHPIYLKKILDSLNIPNEIYLKDTPPDEVPDMVDFFLRYLKVPTSNNENTRVNFSLYPNPASDYIILELPHSEVSKHIKIFDALGNSLIQISQFRTNKSIDDRIRIDVSSLKPGLYFLQTGLNIIKFIKI